MGRQSNAAPDGRGLYTPAAIQTQIIAGTLAGKSKSELHRQTGLGRGTIRRILGQSEVQAILASYHQQALDLVPAALRLCERKLKGRSASWQLAIEILKGTQVLVTKQRQEQQHVVDEIETMTDDELREYIRALLSEEPPSFLRKCNSA
jgi:hypothetical protein